MTESESDIDPPREDYVMREKHIRFFKAHMKLLPKPYTSLDTSRLTLTFFCVSALDLLGALDTIDKQSIIDHIYSLQKTNDRNKGGFRGSTFFGNYDATRSHSYDESHLAMTYSGLYLLKILGDDYSRVDKVSIIQSLKQLSKSNGSFSSASSGTESDVRFVYCACAISWCLDDFSAIDIKKTTEYIMSCQRYDGAFGLNPNNEGHGGSTFCSVASLKILGTLHQLPSQNRKQLILWCKNRQNIGYNGRPNKPNDSCYSFWIGATLALLGKKALIDHTGNRYFLMLCQDPSGVGGFGKYSDSHPDLLHSFYSIAGLCLIGRDGLAELEPMLQISKTAATRFPHFIDHSCNFISGEKICCL